MGISGIVGAVSGQVGPAGSIVGPVLRKGALVELFVAATGSHSQHHHLQVNPESLTRSLTPYDPRSTSARRKAADAAGADKAAPPSPDAEAFDPTETFRLGLLLDASDALEIPELLP